MLNYMSGPSLICNAKILAFLLGTPQTERINIFVVWLHNPGTKLLWVCLGSSENNCLSRLTKNPHISESWFHSYPQSLTFKL